MPTEVQGKLRSGVAIPSLQQCVEELILNSIDAGATCVGVRMDMEAFKVQVIDNGAGMSAEDMKCVGNRYYTSKCSAVEDLDNLKWYGFRGEALASIVSLATLVEISSRMRSSVKTHVKVFKDGKGLDAFEADTARPSAGTTVLICNFFHNMPVRRKRMDSVLEGERIRHRVEAISLMHPSVSFTLKNDCTGAMIVQLPKARNTYHRFVQIHSLGRAQKLGEISYSHGQFEVIGYIGREGHYNNSLQFLYVNDRLLLKTRIHKLLNLLLRRLSTSNQKNESPDGQSAIRSPKHKRSQELHAVYVINIKCPYSEYDICLEPAKTLIEFRDWDGILLWIEEAVKAFLRRENLIAVLSQDDLDYASPKMFGTDNTEQEGAIGGQATGSTSTQNCSVGIKLASEPVHRKHKDDCVCKSSICQESDLMAYDEESEQLEQKELTQSTQLEKIKSEGCINKECRDDQHCDLIHPASDNNITEEEEPTVSKAREGCQSLCLSSSVRQIESEKAELLKGTETQLNNTTSATNVTSRVRITEHVQSDLNTTEKIRPACTGTGGHGQTLVSNKKISLSDPYLHESLETHYMAQICRSTFQQKNISQKCEERSLVSKRKISLEAGHEGPFQKVCKDFASNIPSYIPRNVSCQKMPLCNKSGSLDNFRRVFGKTNEMKSSSLEAYLQNNARLPQKSSLDLNPQNLSLCQKDQQDVDIAKTHTVLQRPPSPSAFPGLRQTSGQVRCKKSLAAKLCYLKQDRTDVSNVLPHLSRATSEDNTCLSSGNDGIQDTNNKENPRDTAVTPETVSSCSTNSQLVDVEEDTASGDWLHHYDTSVGKTVYVNKVTGLSRYQDPLTEETQVHCISDVTNMAVSVVNEMGELVDIKITGNIY